MQSWNDDRLDDLSNRVDAGFAQVDERSARLESRMEEGFARLDDKLDERISRLDEKVDAKINAAAFELRQEIGRSTRLNSSHTQKSRMPSSA